MAITAGNIVRVHRKELSDILFRCVSRISSSVATVTTVRAPISATIDSAKRFPIHVCGFRTKAMISAVNVMKMAKRTACCDRTM
jgi:hypothetical protein